MSKRKVASVSSKTILVRGIGELLTLSSAAAKKARHTQEEDLSSIAKAAMVFSQGKIQWVGSENQIPKKLRPQKEINLRGATVLPSFVESHTHLIFAGHRADEFEMRNQGVSYQEIGRRGGGILSTLKPTRAASVKDLAKLAAEREDKYIKQGVATIEVKSGYGLDTKSEVKMLEAARSLQRARIVPTFLGAHAIPKERGSAEEYIDYLLQETLPKVRKLSNRIDIFVEDGYFNEALADRYLKACREQGFEIVVHADQLTHSGGTRLAIKHGAKSADHLLKIDDKDIAALARSEVTCGLLPSADLYMKCPYPPARSLIEKGARVCLATDFNPGSAPSQDLGLVGVLARVEMKMTLAEVVVAYTLGGAYSLGLESKIGSLEVGKSADFSVFSQNWRELFYSIGSMEAAQVWREGKCLHKS